MIQVEPNEPTRWPGGISDMAGWVRRRDWSATSLGASDAWSPSVKAAVDLVLSCGVPMLALLGHDLVQIYNDGYRDLIGLPPAKGLGEPIAAWCPDAWRRDALIYERVRGGETVICEDAPFPLGRHGGRAGNRFKLSYSPIRGDGDRVVGVLVALTETMSSRTAERLGAIDGEMSAGSTRDSFLLALSDRLRALDDPEVIQAEAARFLGERLDADCCFYLRFEEPDTIGLVEAEHLRSGGSDPSASNFVAPSPSILQALAAGRLVALSDVEVASLLADEERRGLAARSIRALVALPVLDSGRLVACVATASRTPRHWSDDEIRLVRDAAELTRDAAERARAMQALRRSERQLRLAMKAAGLYLWSVDAATGRMEFSDDLAETRELPDHQDAWDIMRRIPADVASDEQERHRLAALAAINGRSDFRETAPVIHPEDGSPIWIEARGTPSRIADGASPRLVGVGANVTGQLQMEKRLRRKNAILEGIARIFREALGASTAEELGRLCLAVAEDVTESGFSFMGEVNFATNRFDELSISDRGWQAFAMDDPRFPYRQAPVGLKIHGIYGRVLVEGRSVIANDPVTHPDRIGTPAGHPPLRSFLGVPLVHDGQTVGMIGLGNREGGYGEDERKAAEALAPAILQALLSKRMAEALAQSEERLRRFGEASSDVLWIRDARTLRWSYLTPAFERIYGVPRDVARAGNDVRNWLKMILPEDRRTALKAIRRVRRGERVSLDYRIRRSSDGEIRWVRNTDFPVPGSNGTIAGIGSISRDITEERELADRQIVLVAELQHRTRNILGVVRAMADRMAGNTTSLSVFLPSYRARLGALSRVNSLLSRLDQHERLTFDTLVRTELGALGVDPDEQDGRVVLQGSAGVRLRSATVQTFALAIHELATNAAKYGALAAATGRLTVAWATYKDEDGTRRLRVEWTETDVPDMPAPDAPPRGGGYGRELIERALPYQLGARTSYELAPDGVRCTIDLPLSAGAPAE